MVKFGKYYRQLHLVEFRDNYIDYKKLKQKIKIIQNSLPQMHNNSINMTLTSTSAIKLRPTLSSLVDETIQENDSFLNKLNEFKDLLNEEFQKFYNFFKSVQKQLYRKLNKHLYTQTNYISYNLDEFLEEVTKIRSTMYLAKCLNEFINDNMAAIKKILKKFDKKFHNFFGNIGPKYILDKLTTENSDMEYLLQFKVIDETSTICESNLKLLKECFNEFCLNNKVTIQQMNEFETKHNSIHKYIKDIDEIIYYRIQYKEWFYFTKKNLQIISESKLFKNLMFNPLLFSAYYKDDLMNKFLSRKEEIKEVENMQISMTSSNKLNITLILIHYFFYNTLISGIYPLLFELVGLTEDKYFIPYSLLIIASTYFFSYFSLMFHKCFGSKSIKGAYVISYIYFMIGSIAYIFSYQENEKDEFNKKLFKSAMIGVLVFSRIIIGLGANPTTGKNYILNYSSKYFLPYISKIYVFISILGHSFGPLIGFFLYEIPNKKFWPFLCYSKYNCIGWYGFIMSFILFIMHIILFTSPKSKNFSRLDLRRSQIVYLNSLSQNQNETAFLENDMEDSQDKEFYKLQKEKNIENSEDNVTLENNSNIEVKEKDKENEIIQRNMSVDDEINKDKEDKEELLEIFNGYNTQVGGAKKSNSASKNKNNLEVKNISNQIQKMKENIENDEPNPLLISIENLEENNIKNENEEEGCFTNVNMIPRTIDEILRKEKITFGYLNKNLLMIIFMLFFNSLLKENFLGYCSYYIYYLITFKTEEVKIPISAKYLSLFISVSYLLEIFSMPFILPLYKLNKLIKKFLIILMCLSLLLMIPITIKFINIYLYFTIISLIFLISSIIEVLSSCYLAYLTPPEWKFSHFNAGILPLVIMTFGKLSGCIICLAAFTGKLELNYYIIIGFTFVGYGISTIFILKSKNFRVKAIARIMRKVELEQNFI